jgi:hypothetical protein
MSKDASLPTDVATLQKLLLHERAVVASMSQTISEQQRKLQQQEHRLAQLLRQFYGPRGERFNPDQLTLFDAAELAALVQETAEAAAAEEEAIPAKRRKKGHGRRPIPADIHRETIAYELSEEDRLCPGCGAVRGEIDRERSEQLWRRTTIVCVFAICITAVVYCWLQRPARYEHIGVANIASRLLDTRTGEVVSPKWEPGTI